jgi:hypothetical protein
VEPEVEQSALSAGGTARLRLRLLLFVPSVAHLRRLDLFLVALLSRGHDVLVAFDHTKEVPSEDEQTRLDALTERYPIAFTHRQLPRRTGMWAVSAMAIRRRLDYLHHVDQGLQGYAAPPDPSYGYPSPGFRFLLALPPFRWQFGRRFLVWAMRRLEAAMPLPRKIKALIADQDPDAVLVSPLVGSSSPQGDFVRVAAKAGIPTALVTGSRDDLDGQGELRDRPELTVVWTEAQGERALNLYGIPRERIVVAAVPSDALVAIEDASLIEAVAKPPGRVLRPVLLLLTPLLVLVSPLFRPRVTARAVASWVVELPSLPKRVRKRWRARSRNRVEREKARVRTAKRKRFLHLESSREQKRLGAQAKTEKTLAGVAGAPQSGASPGGDLSKT